MNSTELLGTFPLILDGEELVIGPKGSLDTLTVSVAAEADTWEEQLEDIDIARNAILPSLFGCHSMWVQDMRLTGRRSGSIATIALNCIGLYQDEEKRKVTISLQTSRVAVGSTESPPANTDDEISLNTLEWNTDLQEWTVKNDEGVITVLGARHPAWSLPVVRATVKETYFTTSAPSTLEPGTPFQPSIDIEDPLDVYNSTVSGATLRANVPAGWVLDSREIDPLFIDTSSTARDLITAPTGLWAVTDTISYYFPFEPG